MESSCEAVGRYYGDKERGVSHGTTRGDKSLSSTFPERRVRIELETNGALDDIEKLKGKDLTISLSRYRKKEKLRCQRLPLEVPWRYGCSLRRDGLGYVFI